MEISRKNFALALTLMCLLTVVNVYGVNQNILFKHTEPAFVANVYVIVEKPGITYALPTGNLITDIGDKLIRNLLASTNTTTWVPANNGTVWLFLSMNSTTPAKSWTYDLKEYGTAFTGGNSTDYGFGRRKGTLVMWFNTTQNDWAYNVTRKFTCTANGVKVYATGCCWNSTGTSYNTWYVKTNNLFSVAQLTGTLPLICNTNDNVTIKWVYTYHH